MLLPYGALIHYKIYKKLKMYSAEQSAGSNITIPHMTVSPPCNRNLVGRPYKIDEITLH
ncbi:hypothetical protein DPMN_180913 [Dreissena polymorpha]|uniref:Uncharacterized protein n=1 Tax=Dreissena polymorpha TaxID=45954 RepID=A0A9D4DDF6_DREPO|nr:hypothetical protein DPMN_180913 [Dreissena polymorpha]